MKLLLRLIENGWTIQTAWTDAVGHLHITLHDAEHKNWKSLTITASEVRAAAREEKNYVDR